jgi:hypothetical protein
MAEMGNLIQEGMRFGFLFATDGRQREGRACAALEKEVDRDKRPVRRVKGRSAASLWSQAKPKEEAIGYTKRFLKVGGDGRSRESSCVRSSGCAVQFS